MQTLVYRTRFVQISSHSCWKVPRVRSSSTSAFENQSRGGLPRFFCEDLPISKGTIARVWGDEFRHMTKVLRLGVNDRLELFNGKGGIVEGCIYKIDPTGLDFMALEDPRIASQRSMQWHVFSAFGTLKGGRADWLVEKCTELGANSVTPLLTKHSPSVAENRVDRLQRVVQAATKQCQRLHEMTLKSPIKIEGLISMISQSKLSFLAVAESTPLISSLPSSLKDTNGMIIVGPEGDFTEEEVELMTKAGAVPVGLGSHRLRVETATIVLLATLMLWSDSQNKP